jgi:tetratricopeptide (TPR) repeat protein
MAVAGSAEDRRKLAAQCWRTGNDAMQNENWDYSIQMFSQCVKIEPDNILFRQALRGVEMKKYGNNKTGAKMGGMKLMGPRGRIKKARMSKNWDAVDKAAEDGLAINPWDAQLNAEVGDAARHQEHAAVAAFAYEKAVECDPQNKEYCRVLAELYEERGDFKLATGVWERIFRLDPMDGEARTRSHQAATKQVIDRGGYEGADSTKGVMADHEVAKRLNIQTGNQVDGPGQSEEADLQRAIRKEPDAPEGYMKLAEFYRRNKQLEDAKQMLEKSVEITGGDASLRELVEDVELEILEHNLRLARENAGDDEAAGAKVKELAREHLLRETEILRGRVDRYSSDLKLKFRLGECFMRDKKYASAIPLLQQSTQDTRLEVKALTNLGKCFMQEKKYPLARRQFEKAVPKLNAHEQVDSFKDVHYWLGRLCEAASDHESAENHYGEVLAVDYEYRDCLNRLESLQGGE